MAFEIGQRVADTSNESVLVLFGRDTANRGQKARAIIDLEPVERTEVPELQWSLGAPGWRPLQWQALHSAFRLTLSQGKGNLASVDWGRLILEPYQLVPLQRIENLPFPRMLLAGDTGLGKTAEAGMILFRLLQKRRADRILVLCRARPEPERWQDELKEKFGIDLTVINDGDDYARIRRGVPSHLNVFGHLSHVAMSMYFAAPTKRGAHIVDDLRRVRWDVVIVDEAHHLAEHGDSGKKLAELGKVVAETSEALLLLTATPHDGRAESFASLLRLLDPYLVVDPDALDAALVRPYVVRRLKGNVVKSDGTRFIRRRIYPLEVQGGRAENWLDMGVRSYCRQLRQRAAELEKAGERSLAMGASFLESFLRKRLASSAWACRLSLERRRDRLRGKAMPPSGEVTADRDESALDAGEILMPAGNSEIAVVEDLIQRAHRIPEGQESKITALVTLVGRILADTREKVLVFTEFTDTLDLLCRVFAGAGWVEAGDDPLPKECGKGLFFRYEGSTPRKKREWIRQRFLERPDVRLLLATDAASESINLHKGCNNLVHLETVWNPNRYEQRNGRIDRYGQTEQPKIYLLINSRSIDERVAAVGYRKLEAIAEDLGSVSDVLPLASRVKVDDFLERFGEERAAEELSGRLEAEARSQSAEETAEGTSDLVRGESFDCADMEAVTLALSNSRAFVPEYPEVEQFLREFLRAEGGRIEPVPGEADVFSIVPPPALRSDLEIEAIGRATFRRDLALREQEVEESERVEFLSPGHPLVRAALQRARGWVYQPGFASRVSYRRVCGDVPPGFLFTFAERFLDGRGEAIEERFDVVVSSLEGLCPGSAEADFRLFTDPGRGGNLTDQESAAVALRFAPAFAAARDGARAQATRRAQIRLEELRRMQQRIVEESFVRLGRWKQAVEDRLRRRFEREIPAPPGPVQLDFTGDAEREASRLERERERRMRAFRSDQERLLAEEEQRRANIRMMEDVRLDAVEPFGALILVPEGIR